MRVIFQGSLLLLAVVSPSAWAQDNRPVYEAALVKINTSGSGSSRSSGTKGQIVMTNLPLKRLIERAYNVKPFQVAAPDWTENTRFDIAAKYPQDSRSEDRPLMLRALLEDRFRLAVHRESKLMRGYALVVAKSGFKLKPVDPGGSGTNDKGGRVRVLTASKLSMELLADYIARTLDLMVVDKTGISGVYDFELRFTTDDQPTGDAANTPPIFQALEETLGLRLQAQRVPVDLIVVDQVDRVPTEN